MRLLGVWHRPYAPDSSPATNGGPPSLQYSQKFQQDGAKISSLADLQCGGSLLVPFRYAKYFASTTKTSVLDLLSMLVKGCQFRPKLLPIHCEFFHHSELHQLHLAQNDLACGLFAEFLSELEGVEFYWIGGLRGKDADGEMTFEANPSMHVPKMFLETALSYSSPKLDTLCMRVYGSGHRYGYDMPKLDSCLADIAPLLSSSHASECKSKTLPISAPYRGVKKLHLFGELRKKASRDVISSIILHQTVIEGIEIMCDSQTIGPGYILDPIYHVLTRPCIQFLVMTQWRDCNFEELFHNFLDVNTDYEISFAMSANEMIIPARNCKPDSGHRSKVLRLFSNPRDVGVDFSWLREAGMDVALRSITIKSAVTGSKNRECFLFYLTTCEALTMEVKGSYTFSDCFNKLSSNKNLRVLKIHGCLPLVSLIDNFCEMLSAIYANCTGSLMELSLLNNRISTLPSDKLKAFFETLVSFANLSQLSVNLRGNALKDTELDLLLKAWRALKPERKFKSLLLDSSEQEEKTAEMVVELVS